MDVRTRIREYFAATISDPVGDEDDIFDLGIVDSMFALQLVTFVEREFAIVAERADLDICNFCSITALVNFVHAKQHDVAKAQGQIGFPPK
jgi:acyl carrier protein